MRAATCPGMNSHLDWADLSTIPGATTSWAHNGLVVTDSGDGELIGFHAGQLVAFDRQGRVVRVVRSDLTEGHGITFVREGADEYLWITDPGFVHVCDNEEGDEAWAALFGKGSMSNSREPRVVKMNLSGEIRAELPIPPRVPRRRAGHDGDVLSVRLSHRRGAVRRKWRRMGSRRLRIQPRTSL